MQIVWKSINREQNRFRFYSLLDSTDLWGQRCIIRRWGRLNRAIAERIDWVKDSAQAEFILESTSKIRTRHGYQVSLFSI